MAYKQYFAKERQFTSKQVAQRATIAHLSPVCQGQMSWFSNLFETYLKVMKPKGLDELCATTSDLANQTRIEIKKQIFWSSTNRTWHPLIKKKNKWAMETRGPQSTRPSYYACPGYQQLWWWFDQKMTELAWKHYFPIISLWELFRPQGQLTP